MTQTLNRPQLGFVIKTTLSIPAGATVELPRPTFPRDRTVSYAHVSLLYQFEGDNSEALELVCGESDTLGTTIPATTVWDYGGQDVPMFAQGFYRYLHNAADVATLVTIVLTRVR